MSQDQEINFACHFYPFGKSIYFPLPNLKFGWPLGYWQTAILSHERVDFSLFIAAPPHMLNC